MAEQQTLKNKHLKKFFKVQVTDFLIPCHIYVMYCTNNYYTKSYLIIVYNNDKWCVENVWNSEQMYTNREYFQRRVREKQRQEELHLSSQALLQSENHGEVLAHLRKENNTLAQWLNEAQQQIAHNQQIFHDVME